MTLVCYFPFKLVFSTKHVDVLKSISVLTSIVTSLLYLKVISTNKDGVGFKDRL
jgi:hypothetical protein